MSGYPFSPGYKEGTTSREAARSMRGRKVVLYQKIIDVLRTKGPMTSDEIAVEIKATPFATRPRVTELKEQGRIIRAGYTRPNASGRRAHVYSLPPDAEGTT